MQDLEDKKIVVQSNQIVESCYGMTLNEKRLLMIGMSKVDPMQIPLEGEPFKFDVTVSEWSEHCSDGSAYKVLKAAAKGLRSRFVEFKDEVGLNEEVNWFDSIGYKDGEGRVALRFSWTIQQRLAGMLKEFTKTRLADSTALTSFHAVRLHELICQFKGDRVRGWRKIMIDDFRFAMNCKDKYRLTKDLKKTVIKPSLEQINRETSLLVTVEDIKKGRKITGFKFIYEDVQNKPKSTGLAIV